jgi:hypothetical protein
MRDWISDLLIFSAGIAGGILIVTVKPFLLDAKKRRSQMAAARARILADIKEKHEEEILHEAFQTAEAIRGELDRSAQLLRKTLLTVVDAAGEERKDHPNPVVPLSEVAASNRSNS